MIAYQYERLSVAPCAILAPAQAGDLDGDFIRRNASPSQPKCRPAINYPISEQFGIAFAEYSMMGRSGLLSFWVWGDHKNHNLTDLFEMEIFFSAYQNSA